MTQYVFAITTDVLTSKQSIFRTLVKSNSDYEQEKLRLEEKCGITKFYEVDSDNQLYNSQSNLKVVDGVVLLKTEDDYRQERIAVSESSIDALYRACKAYQEYGAKPRIDSNFFSLLIQSQGIKKIVPAFECPMCDANISWNNVLWADYDARKIAIANGDVPDYDFSNNGNPPYTWDQCAGELL